MSIPLSFTYQKKKKKEEYTIKFLVLYKALYLFNDFWSKFICSDQYA